MPAGLTALAEWRDLRPIRRPRDVGAIRSIAGRIGGRDQAFAGHDNPPFASKLDTLDPSRPGKKIALADLSLAIASADERDVIASIEHDISAQKGLWAFD